MNLTKLRFIMGIHLVLIEDSPGQSLAFDAMASKEFDDYLRR